MDLGAYSQIDKLSNLLTKNKIEITRLRGLRLMKEEKPISDEELEEVIKEQKKEYLINWLKQHSDCCWDSRKDKNNHPAFIYGENNEVVDYDFSKVHGEDRKHIKFRWKNIEKEYTAQFEMFNRYAGKNVLYVHARQGGGNRFYYPIDTKHPMYLDDIDDAFDSTYCDIYYDLDKEI